MLPDRSQKDGRVLDRREAPRRRLGSLGVKEENEAGKETGIIDRCIEEEDELIWW